MRPAASAPGPPRRHPRWCFPGSAGGHLLGPACLVQSRELACRLAGSLAPPMQHRLLQGEQWPGGLGGGCEQRAAARQHPGWQRGAAAEGLPTSAQAGRGQGAAADPDLHRPGPARLFRRKVCGLRAALLQGQRGRREAARRVPRKSPDRPPPAGLAGKGCAGGQRPGAGPDGRQLRLQLQKGARAAAWPAPARPGVSPRGEVRRPAEWRSPSSHCSSTTCAPSWSPRWGWCQAGYSASPPPPFCTSPPPSTLRAAWSWRASKRRAPQWPRR